MYIYIITLFFLIILSFSKNKKFLFFSFPILFILAGLRSVDVGTDTYNYFTYFNLLGGEDLLRTEFLWISLNQFVSYIGGTFQLLVMCASFLSLFPVFYVIYKSSENPNFSVLVFYMLWYYFYSYNIMRQAIACAFILLAAYFLFKHSYYKTAISLGIAFLFHTVSIIAIPLFVILYFKPSFRSKLFYVSCMLFSLVVGFILGPRLLDFVTTFSDTFSTYNHYVQDLSISTADIVVFILLYDVLFLLVLYLQKQKSQWFQMYFFSILIMNMVVLFPYGERISPLLGTAQLLVFPHFIDNNRIQQSRTLVTIGLFLYCLLGFILKFRANVSGILPYELTFMPLFK